MRTEKILGSIVVLAILLKYLFNITGLNFVLVIGLSAFSLLYFPFAFYFFSIKGIKNQNLALSIIAGLLFSMVPIGIQFKVMYWPGFGPVLLTGVIGSVIILVTTNRLNTKFITKNYSKSNSNLNAIDNTTDLMEEESEEHLSTYYKNLMYRSVVFSCLAIFFWVIPINTLIKFQYREDSEMARLMIQSKEHPENEEYKKQLKDYQYRKMGIMK